MILYRISLFGFLFFSLTLCAQQKNIYEHLPVGKYNVGFKIVTLRDETRIEKPEFNILGEKNEGDRTRKISLHIWYPAKENTGNRTLRYEDYCINSVQESTSESLNAETKKNRLDGSRGAVTRWFGAPTDLTWTRLLQTSMLASADAEPVTQKFPLLIGILRDLSTTLQNEMLASNGYVVVMIRSKESSSFAQSALDQIPDMRYALKYFSKDNNIDSDRMGTFGFSGSGFIQVLFAMNDFRVKALADIESGVYMDVLFNQLSESNYYRPSNLRVPFLHIFSRNLAQREAHINEFENKTAFSQRYRLLLNLPNMHHWDFATEGYTAATVLGNRGDRGDSVARSFEVACTYLLNFFNAVLKKDGSSEKFLLSKPILPNVSGGLWDITSLEPKRPAPSFEELRYIADKKGWKEAINVAKATIPNDSSTDVLAWYNINGMGYSYLGQKKYDDALTLFKFNTELHPEDPNLFDSLAEGYEATGDKENAKKMAEKVLALLAKKETLTEGEKGLKGNAEKRLK